MAISRLTLSEALFGKARRGVLALLFGNPAQAFYTRQIVKYAGSGVSQVQKELERLTAVGLLIRERRANQVYFRANTDAPIFADLRNIVTKTFGAADTIRRVLRPFAKRIRAAFIYGSVARATDTAESDVDLLIVGNLALSEIVKALATAEAKLLRRISPQIYLPKEFAERIRGRQHFISRVMDQQKIFLIGTSNDLQALAEPKAA